MKTSLLLASCEGNTWAFQVESDDEVRQIVSDEMFGDSPDNEEVEEVVSILLREGTCGFEGGSFQLMPGGVRAATPELSGLFEIADAHDSGDTDWKAVRQEINRLR